MEAILFQEHGGLEKLGWGDFPDPVCAPDECVLILKAVALNGFDPASSPSLFPRRTAARRHQ